MIRSLSQTMQQAITNMGLFFPILIIPRSGIMLQVTISTDCVSIHRQKTVSMETCSGITVTLVSFLLTPPTITHSLIIQRSTILKLEYILFSEAMAITLPTTSQQTTQAVPIAVVFFSSGHVTIIS